MVVKLKLIFDVARSLHLDTEKIIENGIIKRMRADWLLPNNTKLEVTLKILNSREHLNVRLTLLHVYQIANLLTFRFRFVGLYELSL